jgi:hypothetical protein
MVGEEIIKNIIELSEGLRAEYIERIKSLINDEYKKIEVDNKEILTNINNIIDDEVLKFQNELDEIYNETLTGLDKRKDSFNQRIESSNGSLKERFSTIFEEIYNKIKSLFVK